MTRSGVAVIGLGGQSAFFRVPHFPMPGETVSCTHLFYELGGKGYNQAVACARMGVPTSFIGAVGTDPWATDCRKALEAEGISICMIPKNSPTAFAAITRDSSGENIVQVYPGAAQELTGEDLKKPEVLALLKNSRWLLLQNELTTHCLIEASAMAYDLGMNIILNPAPAGEIPRQVLDRCSIITPNYGEACALAGMHNPTAEELGARFRELNFPDAVITLGAQGAMIVTKDTVKMIPAQYYGKVVDTTGAGDCFNGVLAAMLFENHSLEESVRRACTAAGISVTRPGAVAGLPHRTEIIHAE